MADRFPGGVISKTPILITGEAVVGANLYAWGTNSSGQLGLAGNVGRLAASGVWTLSEVLKNVEAGVWKAPTIVTTGNRNSPVSVGSLTNWAQVSTGIVHTACVKTDGTLWTWGGGVDGGLGDGTVANKSSPVQIGARTDWDQVSASRGNFTFSVTTSNRLYGWGLNSSGQIGDNTVISRSSPVQVGTLTNWAQVSAGSAHVLAVKTNNTLWAWGNGGSGRLGIRFDSSNKSSPVQIGSLTNWAQVAGGGSFSLAVKTNNTLWSWGRGAEGQLGNNLTSNAQDSPNQVGSLTNWAQASGGTNQAFAVKTDGTLWAWGYGGAGALGSNTVISQSSPIQIGALTNWAQVSAGGARGSAVKTDGTLWGWGFNLSGQLGDGTSTYRSSPVQVGPLTNWAQVSGRGNHTAAIETV